jgi:hypothetical protein
MKLGKNREYSLISLLVMRNDLDSLKWVLKTTVCPLEDIFRSLEIYQFD